MALAIYRLHTEHPHQPCEQPSEREPFGHGGAEWWIQFTPNDECTGGIDLHYDKDETLAEHFNLGSFPAVSTVTYLTAGDVDVDVEHTHSYQTPTRIFQHAYHDDEETPIARMIESYPVIGKHLAFDGRYLHGAPRLPVRSTRNRDDSSSNNSSRGERMTFLVNIWPEGCKPCGSNRLPQHLRDTILSSSNVNVTSALEERIISLENCTKQDILQRNIQQRDVSAVDRISVPFVSTGATWIDPIHEDDSDEEEGLILTMYPTPPLKSADHDHTPTTVCYQWEEGLGPRLEHVYHGNDYDYENEDEVETSVGSLEDANSHTDQAEISSDCYRKQNESILNHMQQNGGIKCVAYI
mmetsp:Transcript_40711/g.47618  ORF Transcript_40711/g.47618 Transcript_40711/m.47618 type:complete len:353 (-) Transcript_40711:54-1112(-)